MAIALEYDKIIKYRATATCMEPLHIGDAVGTREEVLVHPNDEMPFIQATSIAGVFRDYFVRAKGAAQAAGLFGASRRNGEAAYGGTSEDGEDSGTEKQETSEDVVGADRKRETVENGTGQNGTGKNSAEQSRAQDSGGEAAAEEAGGASRVRFTDGTFVTEEKGILMELRPRLAINRATGTCSESTVKGTDRSSGHKFNMEYVGAGACFQFSVYLYDPGYQEAVEDIFAALNSENIQLGGQKSNGCGYVRIERLQRAVFDMKKAEDRRKWAEEDCLPASGYEDITKALPSGSGYRKAYEITVAGRTEGELLVKGIAVMDEGENAPDAVNMKNAGGDYIIPGSSLKGAVRSQMERIAAYLGCEEVIRETFGCAAEADGRGNTGNIAFFDTVVGEAARNDMADVRHRIHIDKFTGGVMERALFSEKNVSGEMKLRIAVSDKNTPDRSCALLLLALRDLAIGVMSLGSGYNIGKGIMEVDTITVTGRDGRKASIDFKAKRTEDEGGLIGRIMASLSA